MVLRCHIHLLHHICKQLGSLVRGKHLGCHLTTLLNKLLARTDAVFAETADRALEELRPKLFAKLVAFLVYFTEVLIYTTLSREQVC